MGMAVQVIIIALMPALLIQGTNRQKILKFMGPIILAYAVGIIMANIPGVAWDRDLSMTVSEIAVPVAIPLVLMSTNLIKWFSLARTTVVSFVLMMAAALLASLMTVLIFRKQVDNAWQLAGMLTGCYTGGTPNLVAIGLSLEVPGTDVVLANTSDMLIGGIYFLLLTSVMKHVYRKVLPPFKALDAVDTEIEPFMKPVFGKGIKKGLGSIGFTVGLAILAAGVAIGLSIVVFGSIMLVPILFLVSSFGIGLSFIKRFHRIEGTWNIAEYVILLFSIGLGGTVDLKEFFGASPMMLLYVATMMFGALVIHLILCRIFSIDADTAMITSTAGVYGPAFIAPVAKALDNQKIIVSGLITGLAGYAVGNYMGILVAYTMKLFV